MSASVEVISRIDLGPQARTTQLRAKNPNHGRARTAQDRKEVAELFQAGKKLPELVELPGRSRGGIRSELIRQGLIERKAKDADADADKD